MGDKTQLMTIAIAAEYQQPLAILMGTTTGMLIADGIGVLCGAWLCKHVQDIYIKWFAGVVFIFFGTFTLKNSVPSWVINPVNVSLYFLVVIALVYLIGVKLANRNRPTPCESITADGITDPAVPVQVVSSIPAATATSNKR
jgi:hypothetical protein